MPVRCWPAINECCICIPSLKTASVIIVVLAIVTNPILSWLMLRHTYALRVSCNLSTSNRMDVVDVNINNVISFGFGINSDLGTSCLTHNSGGKLEEHEALSSKVVKGLGWIVLTADFAFLITSMTFLTKMFRNPSRRTACAFIVTGMIAVVLSTLYGVVYVVACAIRGKGLALCQFVFAFFDLTMWTYFLMVVHAFSKKMREEDPVVRV